MAGQNKEILKAANAAIDAGKYEDFLSFCTDDTRWTFVGDKTLIGKAAVHQWMTATYLVPPNNKVANLITEGDFLTAVGELTLQDADGKEIHYSYCDVWKIRDGKLAELSAYVIKTGD